MMSDADYQLILKPAALVQVVLSRMVAKDKVRTYRFENSQMRMRPPSFWPQYREIFLRRSYAAALPSDARILDLGANVGMAALYFSRHHPGATIDAIECDPQIHELLEHNVRVNDLRNVHTHGFAAWVRDEDLSFAPDGLGGGRIEPGGRAVVRGRDLDRWLSQRETYQMIKMDVEGAEFELFDHVKHHLLKTLALVIEFHIRNDDWLVFTRTLQTLRENGFHLHLRTEDVVRQPLKLLGDHRHLNQINVYASRL